MDDHEALQGFWKLIGTTVDGESFRHPDLGTLFRFAGNRFLHVRTRVSYRFELRPDITPKGFDLILVSTKAVVRGLYELQGDTLRILMAENWNVPRPASLEESAHAVETYEPFKRRLPIKRRVRAQIPRTVLPGGFIPRGLLDDFAD